MNDWEIRNALLSTGGDVEEALELVQNLRLGSLFANGKNQRTKNPKGPTKHQKTKIFFGRKNIRGLTEWKYFFGESGLSNYPELKIFEKNGEIDLQEVFAHYRVNVAEFQNQVGDALLELKGQVDPPLEVPEGLTIEKSDFLGKGTFGAVYKATDDENNIYALKIYNDKFEANQEAQLLTYVNKIDANGKSENEHVISYFGYYREKEITVVYTGNSRSIQTYSFVLSELVSGKPLDDTFITSSIGDKERWDYLGFAIPQIFKGLSFLHKKGVAHRDIKPDNIMIELPGTNPKGRVVLIDLGLSCVFDHDKIMERTFQKWSCDDQETGGAAPYTSPAIAKILWNNLVSKTRINATIEQQQENDFYAAAFTILECMSGRRFYSSLNVPPGMKVPYTFRENQNFWKQIYRMTQLDLQELNRLIIYFRNAITTEKDDIYNNLCNFILRLFRNSSGLLPNKAEAWSADVVLEELRKLEGYDSLVYNEDGLKRDEAMPLASGRKEEDEVKDQHNKYEWLERLEFKTSGGLSTIYNVPNDLSNRLSSIFQTTKPLLVKEIRNIGGTYVHRGEGQMARMTSGQVIKYTVQDFDKEVLISTKMGNENIGPEIFDAWYDTDEKEITDLYGDESYTLGTRYYIVMEDLSDNWRSWQTAEEEKEEGVFSLENLRTVLGLVKKLLQEHDISHNDLHLGNIFWKKPGFKEVRLIDWGEAEEVTGVQEKRKRYEHAIQSILKTTYLDSVRRTQRFSFATKGDFIASIRGNQDLEEREDDEENAIEFVSSLENPF